MNRTKGLVSGLRDLVDDLTVTIGRSLLRALLLGLGAAVACGVLAFSIVESSTQASRVADRFDALAATRLQVDLPLTTGTYRRLGPEQLDALAELPGVVSVAWVYQQNTRLTSIREPQWELDESVRSYTVGGDAAVLGIGRDAGEERLPGDGLWLGAGDQDSRAVPRFALVELGGDAVPVAGLVRRSDLLPEMLSGVIRTTPADAVDLTRTGKLVVQARLGWAEVVAGHLRGQLEPVSPDRVQVVYPPEADQLRADVVTRVDSLVLVITGALLLVSAVTVGLATFARVLERRRLIGLQRAIGASRRGIVVGLAVEAAVIGVLAGLAGALVGLVLAVWRANQDGGTPVVPWPLIAGGLAVAFLVNGLGALGPAWAATRVSPIRAIRDL